MGEYPHIRKVGRYAFYCLCAFGVGLLAYAAMRALGVHRDVQRMASDVAALAAFLMLRDAEKNAVAAARAQWESHP